MANRIKPVAPNPGEFAEAAKYVDMWIAAEDRKLGDRDVQQLVGYVSQGVAHARAMYAPQVQIAQEFRKSYKAFAEKLGVLLEDENGVELTDEELMGVFQKHQDAAQEIQEIRHRGVVSKLEAKVAQLERRLEGALTKMEKQADPEKPKAKRKTKAKSK